MNRPRRRAALRSASLAAALAFAAASCATKPSPPAEPPTPEPALVVLSLYPLSVAAVDIDEVRVEAGVRAVNGGSIAAKVGPVEWRVELVDAAGSAGAMSAGGEVRGGEARGTAGGSPGELASARRAGRAAEGIAAFGVESLEPGQASEAAFRFELEVPPGDAPLVGLRARAAAAYSGPDGAPRTAEASIETEFPRILKPTLDILSIRILKDELINTRLGVAVAVRNPNVFPLRFSSLGYKLYGEGRYWASGSLSKPFEVPARGSAEADLYLTMNFTDMDRSLFDRVVKLAMVSYRLSGNAEVETGLAFLPLFRLPFDLSGRSEVR